MIQSLTVAIKESWILKGFLGLVMMSFAVWGVGDAINPAVDPNIVIKVDQVEVRTNELQRRFNAEVDELRNALGPDFTAKEAAELGILDNLVNQLSERASLDMAAREMGLFVPDETLRRAVFEQDAFKDETGNFNRLLLNQTLANNQLTEQDFIDLLRSDVTRQTLLQPIAANGGAPKVMVDALFRFRAEQRVADILYVADSTVEITEEPDEATLREVYDENIDNFTAPEYREIEAILIRPDDLVPADSITDEDIQLFYDENIDRYREQPTRTVRQLIFPDEQAAAEALSQLQDGETLVELGERTGMGAPIDLGVLSATDDLGFDLTAVFALVSTGVTSPVQSDFGWHLFEVTDLTTGSVKSLPVVRQEIIDFIISDRAFEEMFQAEIYLEDQLAGGVPMKEIGETPGYTYLYVAEVDREGRDSTGAPVDLPVAQDRFLRIAFGNLPGLDSQTVQSNDYAYVQRVLSVTEPSPKPYDRVAADVRVLWEEQVRAASSADKANSLVDAIGPSADLAALAAENEAVEFANLGPVTRFGDSLRINFIIPARLVSPALMDALFQANTGDVVEARVANGHVVARLEEVILPDETELAQIREQVENTVANSLVNDLVVGYTTSIIGEYDVVLNRESIDQLIPQ